MDTNYLIFRREIALFFFWKIKKKTPLPSHCQHCGKTPLGKNSLYLAVSPSLYSHKTEQNKQIEFSMAFVLSPVALLSLAPASSRASYYGPLLTCGASSSPFTAARPSSSSPLSTSSFVPRPLLSSSESSSDAMRFPFRRRSVTTLPVFRPRPPFKGDVDYYDNDEHYYPTTTTTKTLIPLRTPTKTPTEKLRRLVPSGMTQTTPATSAQRTRPYVANTVTFTCIDNNGFMLRYNDTRVLVDPWLTGDLIFNNTKFFRMVKPSVEKVGRLDLDAVSAIVLTQGLPDHTHSETLALFRKDIPIVAPPSSAPVLSALGFTRVVYAEHEQEIGDIAALGTDDSGKKKTEEDEKDGGVISLKCLKGSLVGPPWSQRQLALLFTFKSTPSSTSTSSTYILYHEPHGDHHYPSLSAEKGRVDGVVVPVVRSHLQFPLGLKYPLVYGMATAVRLCRAVRPATVIGFDNSRGVAEGSLTKMIRATGGYQTMVDDIDELNSSSSGGKDDDMKVKHVIAHADVMVEVALTGDSVGDIIGD